MLTIFPRRFSNQKRMWYEQVKQLYPEAIAAIRVGDFYEFFAEDAERVSELLDLTLTTRQTDGADRVPMCGVPFHATEKYFSKLLDAGIRIAVDDDDLTPKLILPNTAKQENELERAKAYIREYLIREFDEREDHFEDLNRITLAYTTTEDEDIPVQAEVDLVEYTLKKYLGDILVETNSFDSLKEMNDNLLCGLNFGELTEVTDDQIALYHRETDIPQFTEEAKQRKTLPVYNSHPEISDSDKHNYRITDDEIGMGGAKEKFRKNIAAINLLHELEFDNRLATPEEQEILAQYSGWGGLADAFDDTKDNWSKEFAELYTTLSPEEYRAAEESTLTAFYTPPVVIKAMYKALENMGFKRGNILEPSCGVGNFMGLVPENMDAKMYGVELDSLSGRIARQLYQKNGITISGYEKTEFPDSFFDVAIGNVPFNDFKLLDKRYDNDNFTYKYGLINSRANAAVFSDDNSYFLLCSLEILDENKQLKAKADMFYKRTINPQTVIDRVDTASEALAVSIGERAGVDMEYMSALTGKSEEELFADLGGVVFLNPRYDSEKGNEAKYLTADEYLSGNVRQKLQYVREKVESGQTEFAPNVEALEAVQPVDLTAAEIGVKLGSTWIPEDDVKAFMIELLTPSYYIQRSMDVKYIGMTGQWVITEKNYDVSNVKANSTYGTHRINAYHIIEETLNLKDVRVMDYVEDRDGNKKAVLNKKETMIAQGKQEQIKRAFDEWIWKDPERRERLCRLYNEKFNSIRPREYDGSHIRFAGMNPEITLRQHQKNAVARSLYGGNSLYAHVVGAGKTFTMVAAAQEGKRLGLCSKSMFVVPNHLIEQWASEYLQLYPSANILVTTKKDFETKNRKKFCARIATGDYDAVIIGHSQFEKIPVSVVRQMRLLQAEIDTITDGIEKLKYERGERVTVKQFQRMKKQLETKLEKLNDQSRKDDVVCFEELGVDRLFVDESHFYKNLFAFTKMRNVAGIAQSEAQKSSDLFMKCRYLDELTGGKGITFATGTPISNTMVELYTIQRYLQYDELNARGLSSFDAWASTFGETVTAIELAPDGTGYRAKTRFAKFYNIPELMAMFKQIADVQTSDMLNLPVPQANFHVVKTAPSEIQKKLVQSFSERAEKIHNKMVTAQEDNMLLVTNDGRKAALDQRLIDPMLPDFEGSKVNACVQNVYDIWERNTDKKSAQLVFCDLSTPKNDGSFNVYDDIKTKLIQRGIPPEEIAFIHSADTDVKKKELFGKVRAGQVRVLLGSTFKMGAGTNVQQRLIALHDLDVPWRPSDLEQRSGRIIRQGNSNPEVDIYRYVTESTFDAYCYQLLESKQKFISQIMTSKSPVRVAEDIDETALSYAEIKALASGNPLIMEKMQLDNDVAKLKLQKAEHLNQRYALEDKILKQFPKDIAEIEERIAGYTADLQTVREHTLQETDGEKVFSPMVIMGQTYTERADAGKAILEICKKITTPDPRPLGEYRGLKTEIGFDTNRREFFIDLKGKMTYRVSLGQDAGGIITRLDNVLNGIEKQIKICEEHLAELHIQVENAKVEITKPFPDEAVLEEKSRRLDELNSKLNMDKRENEIAEDEVETGEAESPKGNNRDEPDER